MDYINSALCYAESNDVLAECFAVRANLFYELEAFKQCDRNIKLARRLGDFTKKIDLCMDTAENVCNRMKLKEEAVKTLPLEPTQIPFTLKLSGLANPEIPFIDNRLYLDFDDRVNGRHLRVRDGLGAGKILAIDTILNPALMKEARYMRCATCFNENLFDLDPCPSCCSAMFCAGKDCWQIAKNGFHRFECPVIDFLLQNIEYRAVFRNVTNTFCTPADIADFQQFTSCYDYGLLNFWTMNWANPPHNYQAKLAYTLEAHEHQRPMNEQFYLCRMTAYLVMVMKEKTSVFSELFPDESKHDFLRDFCHRMEMICVKHLRAQTNSSTVRFAQESMKQSSFAVGLHPIISMITHDCKGNVNVVGHHMNKAIVYTTRPIKEGGQLFLDYW